VASTHCMVCGKDLPLITSPRPRTVREPTALGTSFFVQVQRDGMDASSTLLATVIYGTRWSAVGPTCHSCFNFSFFFCCVIFSLLPHLAHPTSAPLLPPLLVARLCATSRQPPSHTPTLCRPPLHAFTPLRPPPSKKEASSCSYQLAPPLLPIQFSHAAIKPSSSLLSSLSIDLLLHCRLPLFHKSNPHKIRRQQEPPCELPSA